MCWSLLNSGIHSSSACPGRCLQGYSPERITQRVPEMGQGRGWDRAPYCKQPSHRTQDRAPQSPSCYLPGRDLGTLSWGIWLIGVPQTKGPVKSPSGAPGVQHTLILCTELPINILVPYPSIWLNSSSRLFKKRRETRIQGTVTWWEQKLRSIFFLMYPIKSSSLGPHPLQGCIAALPRNRVYFSTLLNLGWLVMGFD